jgi:hypothetical protein
VKHSDYSAKVRSNLEQLIASNRGKKISVETMRDFIANIEAGKDYRGALDKKLKAFNDAIRRAREAYVAGGPNRGFRGGFSIAEVRTRGRNYLKGPRFMDTATGAALASIASSLILEHAQAVECAAASPSFRLGVQALDEGDLNNATAYMIGDNEGTDSFYGDLLKKGHDKAALNFKTHWLEAMKRAQERAGRLETRQ